MRATLVALSLAAAACVIPQQQPQTQPQAQPRTSPAAQGYAAASAPTCGAIFQCYGECQTFDDACVSRCDAGADPTTVTTAHAFAMCILQYKCGDAGCMQAQCSTELAACTGSATPVTDTTGTATAGNPSTGPSTGTETFKQDWTPTVTGTVATGTVRPSGVRGDVYVGISLTSGGLYDYGSHEIAYRVLMEDGTAIEKLPATGLDDIDLDALRGYLPDMTGTYVWNGDNVEMTFGTYHEEMVRRGDGKLDGTQGVAGTFTLADRLDGVVLDGTYAAGDNAPRFVFSRDGHFASDKDEYIMLTDQLGNWLQLPQGTGTYRVGNNTLTLHYDTGEVRQVAIVTLAARGDFPTPDTLLLNTYPYYRR